jgi:hypothetical protein
MRRTAIMAASAMALLLGCANVDDEPPIRLRDRASFDANVWPILVRDCGFSDCHGSTERFFRVVGPGHERLDPLMQLNAAVTEAELQFSYTRALAVLDENDPASSLLLRKPLEVSAGGAGHEGTDAFGLDVYRSVNDPSYQALRNWVVGATP